MHRHGSYITVAFKGKKKNLLVSIIQIFPIMIKLRMVINKSTIGVFMEVNVLCYKVRELYSKEFLFVLSQAIPVITRSNVEINPQTPILQRANFLIGFRINFGTDKFWNTANLQQVVADLAHNISNGLRLSVTGEYSLHYTLFFFFL